MPDWFYRTVSQPILFPLPAERARDFALGFMGWLARLPLGGVVIDLLGHMRPDERLACTHNGVSFATAVGLGPGLDGAATALPALSRFGVGFIDIGLVTLTDSPGQAPIERRDDQQAIWQPDAPTSLALAANKERIAEAGGLDVPIIARLGVSAGADGERASDECTQLLNGLAPHVTLPALATFETADTWSASDWTNHVARFVDTARQQSRPILLCIPADLDNATPDDRLQAAVNAGVAGFLVDGSVRAEQGGRLIGEPARAPALACVRRLRERFGPDVLIVASGGVHEPEHALALRQAGANLVEVDSGLVFSGPGLPKRINDALLFEATRDTPAQAPERAAEMSWLWTFLMGAGMLLGSIIALAIAATRVVLPYDEAYLGLSRDEIARINPRLLAFMAHDRVSLAGTMIAIGFMYVGLSLFGVRRGLHWAQLSVFASAFTGFATFFLFLGFDYFDPFHAFVTGALLQLLLLGVHGKLGTHVPEVAPPLCEDAAWRRAQWGQLLLILHACGLLAAGVIISCIGVTHVFVHEDLEFMQTTAEALRAAHPRLVPLVAHDRATFGGMLLASGLVFLLPALWGIRNGSAWLWWTMLLAGLSAYVCAIGVHYAVGYVDFVHLLPAFAGLGLLLAGLALARDHLCDS